MSCIKHFRCHPWVLISSYHESISLFWAVRYCVFFFSRPLTCPSSLLIRLSRLPPVPPPLLVATPITAQMSTSRVSLIVVISVEAVGSPTMRTNSHSTTTALISQNTRLTSPTVTLSSKDRSQYPIRASKAHLVTADTPSGVKWGTDIESLNRTQTERKKNRC